MPVSKPPPKLKTLGSYIVRAHQIDSTDPVIAYWCYYYAVQLVLRDNLHSGDAEATQYTTALLDELEGRKEKLLPNDAVTDDLAAQAYLENFAMRVFLNADKTLQARKVSRQTIDNFLAAATFLELCKIFPNVDPEVPSKIKFAKYQASRIMKAIQSGEDPNLPLPDTPKPQGSPVLRASTPPKPTVEDVPDEDAPSTPQFHHHRHHYQPQSPQMHPPPRTASPPTPPPNIPTINTPSQPPISSSSTSDRFPLHHSHVPPAQDSDYFPSIPIGRTLSPLSADYTTSNTPAGPMSPFHMPTSVEPPLHPPPADAILTDTNDISHFPPHLQYPSAPPQTQFPPQHFDQSSVLHHNRGGAYTPIPPPPTLPFDSPSTPQHYYSPPPPPQPAVHPAHVPPPRSTPQTQPQYFPQQTPSTIATTTTKQQETFVDDESITKAQKHAKWAISALNYDDIPTAVKELRAALKTLGAN